MTNCPTELTRKRRKAVLKVLGDRMAVVFAGEGGAGLHGAPWRPNPHFEYLTGLRDEPGAILLLDPSHPQKMRRCMLFLKPRDPEMERWDGVRPTIGGPLREQLGFPSIFRTSTFGRWVTEAAKRNRGFVALHPPASPDAPLSPDLELFGKISARIPGRTTEEAFGLVPNLRHAKDEWEIDRTRAAAVATASGYADALPWFRDGANESDIQREVEHGYRCHGAEGPHYGTIVGGGVRGTMLHYINNDQPLIENDLVVLDSGARVDGYGADVTRTIPVGGTFTPRAKEIYNIVLSALDAAIAVVKPGVTFAEIDEAARSIIKDAGYGETFIHGIGHHLGLEVHDDGGEGPLQEGAIITVEPGIYLESEGLGCRIEDDILVTADGHENLTKMIPRTVEEVEQAFANSN